MALRRIQAAPMVDVTTRQWRRLLRMLTNHTTLFTEMLVANAVCHRVPRDSPALWQRALGLDLEQDADERTVVQLAGSEPKLVAEAARLLTAHGLREFNLNVGCPSPRTSSARFGCVLMKSPHLVADIVRAMADVTQRPVSVKCRLGVDEFDSLENLNNFVETVVRSGAVTHLIVHARKAWLHGLSPKENRHVPPIMYERVYQLRHVFPTLHITLNGEIKTWAEAEKHLQHVDAVMIGRQASRTPFMFAATDQLFFGDDRPSVAHEEALLQYCAYADHDQRTAQLAGLHPDPNGLLKPILNIFHSQAHGRHFRRIMQDRVTTTRDVASALRAFIDERLSGKANEMDEDKVPLAVTASM